MNDDNYFIFAEDDRTITVQDADGKTIQMINKVTPPDGIKQYGFNFAEIFSYNSINFILNYITQRLNKPVSCTVAELPAPADRGAGYMLYVTDESDGACIAYSDGTNWRRVDTNGVVTA